MVNCEVCISIYIYAQYFLLILLFTEIINWESLSSICRHSSMQNVHLYLLPLAVTVYPAFHRPSCPKQKGKKDRLIAV